MMLIGALGGGFITRTLLIKPMKIRIDEICSLITCNAIPVALMIGGVLVWKYKKVANKPGIAFVSFMMPIIITKSDISDMPVSYGTRVSYFLPVIPAIRNSNGMTRWKRS